jgi:hypothetical protein
VDNYPQKSITNTLSNTGMSLAIDKKMYINLCPSSDCNTVLAQIKIHSGQKSFNDECDRRLYTEFTTTSIAHWQLTYFDGETSEDYIYDESFCKLLKFY